MLCISTSQFYSLLQPGHPVEVCQSGPEADECLLGGMDSDIVATWGQYDHNFALNLMYELVHP